MAGIVLLKEGGRSSAAPRRVQSRAFLQIRFSGKHDLSRNNTEGRNQKGFKILRGKKRLTNPAKLSALHFSQGD